MDSLLVGGASINDVGPAAAAEGNVVTERLAGRRGREQVKCWCGGGAMLGAATDWARVIARRKRVLVMARGRTLLSGQG